MADNAANRKDPRGISRSLGSGQGGRARPVTADVATLLATVLHRRTPPEGAAAALEIAVETLGKDGEDG
jgi:hypothetical protein